uniref:Beta-amyloid-like protein n=1 Tax=Hirondellea gigas TaxID=1518452 RepID=A0A2P2HW38_9CRUS
MATSPSQCQWRVLAVKLCCASASHITTMATKVVNYLIAPLAVLLFCSTSLVQCGSSSSGSATGGSRFEPQVAMVCRGRGDYLAQSMSPSGHWVTDTSTAKVTCLKDKVDILHYCKQVYPDRDITNIVESSHYYQVPNFCRVGHSKCKASFWVKPYRCLEGQFQSDALLVPEGCLFDHIHNQSRCWQFDLWNTTADKACKERHFTLKAFAMLLPCGIDVFSGVEFVCCPKTYKGRGLVRPQEVEEPLALPSREHHPSPVSSSTTPPTPSHTKPTTTPQEVGTRDSYFSRFDPHEEHEAYRNAEQRLEERHREKVSKIMKEWSELEQRYQELRNKDQHGADQFKGRMTHRFQTTVDAVEAENEAEKHQLSALHQQRVVAHINEMKREAMTCYTRALRETQPNTHKVQKCLQKLLRSLNKDRHHTVAHYKHLLNSDYRAAERERDSTLQHLSDLDRMTNQSLLMLQHHHDLYNKMGRVMHEYATSLRRKDTTPSELNVNNAFAHRNEVGDDISEQNSDYDDQDADDDDDDDEYAGDEADEEDEEDEEDDGSDEYDSTDLNEADEAIVVPSSTKAPSIHDSPVQRSSAIVAGKHQETGLEVDASQNIAVEVSSSSHDDEQQDSIPRNSSSSVSSGNEEDATVAEALPHHQETPLAAHAQHHSLGHQQLGYSVRREGSSGGSESRGVYFTLAFAGVALMAAMVVGIVVLRRRAVRHPSTQGFMEVDQNATVITPEERHVANMQVNGYENPTYKFFEEK